MAKHFGRNQRRKLLERIAHLEAQSRMGLQPALPSDLSLTDVGCVLTEELQHSKGEWTHCCGEVYLTVVLAPSKHGADKLMQSYTASGVVSHNGLRFIAENVTPLEREQYIGGSPRFELRLRGMPVQAPS